MPKSIENNKNFFGSRKKLNFAVQCNQPYFRLAGVHFQWAERNISVDGALIDPAVPERRSPHQNNRSRPHRNVFPLEAP